MATQLLILGCLATLSFGQELNSTEYFNPTLRDKKGETYNLIFLISWGSELLFE